MVDTNALLVVSANEPVMLVKKVTPPGGAKGRHAFAEVYQVWRLLGMWWMV